MLASVGTQGLVSRLGVGSLEAPIISHFRRLIELVLGHRIASTLLQLESSLSSATRSILIDSMSTSLANLGTYYHFEYGHQSTSSSRTFVECSPIWQTARPLIGTRNRTIDAANRFCALKSSVQSCSLSAVLTRMRFLPSCNPSYLNSKSLSTIQIRSLRRAAIDG
jgi:hypothetical protein